MSNTMPQLHFLPVQKDLTKIWCQPEIVYRDENNNPIPEDNKYDIYFKIQGDRSPWGVSEVVWKDLTEWKKYTKIEDTILSMEYIIKDYYNDTGRYNNNSLLDTWASPTRYVGYLKYGDEVGDMRESMAITHMRNFNSYFYANNGQTMKHERINKDTIYAYVIESDIWNDFTAILNEMLSVKGLSQRNFPIVSRKTTFSADIYNKVLSAMKSMQPITSIKYVTSQKTPITAEHLNELFRDFNEILPYK